LESFGARLDQSGEKGSRKKHQMLGLRLKTKLPIGKTLKNQKLFGVKYRISQSLLLMRMVIL
jgi:hypothetical protein